MRWNAGGDGKWRNRFAWLPRRFEDKWIWLERYQIQKTLGLPIYRLPGSNTIYRIYP